MQTEMYKQRVNNKAWARRKKITYCKEENDMIYAVKKKENGLCNNAKIRQKHFVFLNISMQSSISKV